VLTQTLTLVLAARLGAAAPCSPGDVKSALLDLFPPADANTRAAGVRRLAECREARAAGVLTAVLSQDPEPGVRGEVVRALSTLQGQAALPLLRQVLDNAREAFSVRSEALHALVGLGDRVGVQRAMTSPTASRELRTEAFEALARAPVIPDLLT
jgi:hypothetical protein